jgi:hypothetical protein
MVQMTTEEEILEEAAVDTVTNTGEVAAGLTIVSVFEMTMELAVQC